MCNNNKIKTEKSESKQKDEARNMLKSTESTKRKGIN